LNTPAHVAVNAFLLGRGRFARRAAAIALGAALPDLPIFGFYLYQRFGLGASERSIWSHTYFQPPWQALFDAFHSLPLIALTALLAWRSRRTALLACALSMALHVAFDLPLHGEDSHAHFWPLSDWHFRSPVSYWDPRLHGRTVALVELAASLAACVAVWRRGSQWRWIAGGVGALYAVGIAVAVGWWSSLHAHG
jgi:hypothetical protein